VWVWLGWMESVGADVAGMRFFRSGAVCRIAFRGLDGLRVNLIG
jgi:hypothetical protein